MARWRLRRSHRQREGRDSQGGARSTASRELGDIIRPEEPADYAAIAAVVEAAFGTPNEARLVEAIRASDNFIPELSLVAEHEGAVVGHAMFSYVTLRGTEDFQVLSLAPVSVAPEWQSRGIGGDLIRAGIAKAEAREEPLICVLGDPPYYARFGFEPARQLGIEAPSPGIDAAFMAMRLSKYDERYRGRIEYPPAFDVT